MNGRAKNQHIARIILVLSSSWLAGANAQHVIQPTPEDEAYLVRQSNDYYLQKHGYYARQQQLVHIDTDLLRSGGSFQLQLFDLTMDVETVSVRESETGNTVRWIGKLANKTVSIEDLMTEFPSPKLAEHAFAAIFEIKITLSLYERDGPTGAIFPVNFRDTDVSADEFRAGNLRRSNLFFGASANFVHAVSGRVFRLIPLEMGDGVHLLIEIDPKKQLRPGHAGKNLEADAKKHHDDARDFLNSLGPDPRRQILRKKWANSEAKASSGTGQ
jgi:hypothetical protein